MKYFAYSTYLNRKHMNARCPQGTPLFTARLPHYKLVFLGWSREWHGATASIRVFRGEKVPGAVYEMPEACLQQIEKHETGYTRLKVTVYDEDNEPVEAMTHIRSGQIEENKPAPEYLALIKQGYVDWSIT